MILLSPWMHFYSNNTCLKLNMNRRPFVGGRSGGIWSQWQNQGMEEPGICLAWLQNDHGPTMTTNLEKKYIPYHYCLDDELNSIMMEKTWKNFKKKTSITILLCIHLLSNQHPNKESAHLMLIGVVENKAASGVPAAPLSAHADATARWHLERKANHGGFPRNVRG